jgi:cystathionine beta-lyase/cystathionine gamma-synthase
MKLELDDEQICLGCDEDIADNHGAVMPPIAQTSLFRYKSFRDLVTGLEDKSRHFVYSRGQNPTVESLERKLADLERGEVCKCFGSGMAAISSVLMGLLQNGDHLLFVNNIYGPTLQLAEHLRRFGIEHDIIVENDMRLVESKIRANTRMIFFESPGTMLFRMLDVEQLVSLARDRELITVMDNTWATPLFQKPLTKGVDVAVHSCTKYLGGHSDVVSGAAIASHALMEQIFNSTYMLHGGILAPFDAWLLIRGLRTLPVRMRQHQADGLEVARFLNDHPAVRTVFHPALHAEDKELADRELTGTSSLFSIELVRDQFDDLCRFMDRLNLFRIGVSWGGVESLVVSPNRGNNLDFLQSQGIPPGLVRFSVGLEGPEKLIADLDQSLRKV